MSRTARAFGWLCFVFLRCGAYLGLCPKPWQEAVPPGGRIVKDEFIP